MKYSYFIAVAILLSNCDAGSPPDDLEEDLKNDSEYIDNSNEQINEDANYDADYNFTPPHLGGRVKDNNSKTPRPNQGDSLHNMRVKNDSLYAVPDNINYLDSDSL